jgi:uncharacterized protein YwgA
MDNLSSPEQAIIALLYCKGKNQQVADPIFGKTILVKLLFLLWKNKITSQRFNDFAFEPYHYGPYDDRIDLALDELSIRELISTDSGNKFRIALTRKGISEARNIWENLSIDEKRVICDIKKTFGSMSIDKLLKSIYAAYPEYAIESKYKH